MGWQRTAQALGVRLTSEQEARLSEYEQTVRHGLWAWPHERGVVVCDRPVTCQMEESRPGAWRLHSAESPAMAFGDGYCLYAWHGIRVPEAVITRPTELVIADFEREGNQEVRRAMIEAIGWPRYLALAGAHAVQRDECGDLYRVRVAPTDPEHGLVVVTNGTPEPDGTFKRYGLYVSPAHCTAKAAVASTYGLTASTYRPSVRT